MLRVHIMTDTEQETVSCDYCERGELAYEMHSDRGKVVRCIPCLAIEQAQQKLRTPLDSYDDLDDDLLQSGYQGARDWLTILARIQDDDPLIKRDPDAIGTVSDRLRESLTNLMGSEAHYPPSEVAGSEVHAAQVTLGDGDE